METESSCDSRYLSTATREKTSNLLEISSNIAEARYDKNRIDYVPAAYSFFSKILEKCNVKNSGTLPIVFLKQKNV